jgi:hypothetical protein
MPSVSVRLSKSQIGDITAICKLGAPGLNRVADALERMKPTLKRTELNRVLSEAAGSADASRALSRALPGMATAIRKLSLKPADLLQSFQAGLSVENIGDMPLQLWHECRPIFEKILSAPSISLYAKARDLAFDFERLYARARILTDIRPVYDDDRDDIVGANVTQTLRLDFHTSEEGTKSLTFALDIPDIEQLKKCCEDALRKAEVARRLIEKNGLEATLPGERQQ